MPRAAPQNAAVVNGPRLFTDPATGAINGLQNAPPTPLHSSGMNWGPTPITDACHDITTYPAIGLAAGACEGDGLLLDISDPANPVRIDAVADPNYAYWHGATFSNDGTKVVFTDEWGGGTSACCREADPVTGRPADQLNWGANAIFDIVDRKLVFRSYYKMPAVQRTRTIDRAERLRTGGQAQAAGTLLRALANQLEGEQYEDLREALRALADA